MGNNTYFETKESPIICCKCNTPICNTLFAVNELKLKLLCSIFGNADNNQPVGYKVYCRFKKDY